jgi:hypothetical protein
MRLGEAGHTGRKRALELGDFVLGDLLLLVEILGFNVLQLRADLVRAARP